MASLRSLFVLCSIAGLAAAQAQGDMLKLPLAGELMDKWGKAPKGTVK